MYITFYALKNWILKIAPILILRSCFFYSVTTVDVSAEVSVVVDTVVRSKSTITVESWALVVEVTVVVLVISVVMTSVVPSSLPDISTVDISVTAGWVVDEAEILIISSDSSIIIPVVTTGAEVEEDDKSIKSPKSSSISPISSRDVVAITVDVLSAVLSDAGAEVEGGSDVEGEGDVMLADVVLVDAIS